LWKCSPFTYRSLSCSDSKRLARLDELTRNLLEHRMTFMTREFEQVLPKAEKFGDVLGMLAARNRLSLHVAAPRSLKLASRNSRTYCSGFSGGD
jgi:hypothetical protein